MRLEDFSYDLPPDRIAAEPAEPRDLARMLVCRRADPGFVEHARIADLPRYLRPGDLLVYNDTRVRPWRLVGRRRSGGRVTCLVLALAADGAAEGFLRPARRLRPGERLEMEGGAFVLEVLEHLGGGRFRFRLSCSGEGPLEDRLEEVGRAPLPPYLPRDPEREDVRRDRERYQTIFARESGAVAAPTAGLHFTPELLARLERAGVRRAPVTLHVGEGTFEPIRTERIEDHRMHAEDYVLPEATAAAVAETRRAGGRVVCVGTTSVRVLETCFDEASGRLRPGRGRTDLFIRPGRPPRVPDAILTNFHLPGSSLLVLVAAVLGRERTLALYETAVRAGYRFYSFGDAMLILP